MLITSLLHISPEERNGQCCHVASRPPGHTEGGGEKGGEGSALGINMVVHRVSKIFLSPWLVWLSGLSACLRTKGSLVRFPVRAHAWVAGQIPSGGHVRGNHWCFSPSLSPSLSHSLKINKNKIFLKKIYFYLFTSVIQLL